MKTKPVGHRILVQLEAFEEITDSGIVLATHSERKRQQAGMDIGTVLALGPNAFLAFDDGKPWCEVGDKVRFVRYSGNQFKSDDGKIEYSIINDEDIYAIVEDDDE